MTKWLKLWKLTAIFALICGSFYGSVRLYYHLTDGFRVQNITSDFSYREDWNTREITEDEKSLISSILDQEFHYLGKGCQSYVFASSDGEYVLKFFKYQRFRQKPWAKYFTFLPGISSHTKRRDERKKQKLENLFQSCKIAFNNLQDETGLVYVHLNKTDDFKRKVVIYDKLGVKHELEINRMEFLLQKRAQMICSAVNALMSERKVKKANRLIQNFINMILTEYGKGLADSDHALMQNTGIYKGKPIHVDVGQFGWHDTIKHSAVYRQELFNKTYKFRLWLEENHPELLLGLNERLQSIIGEDFNHMTPSHLN